MPNVNNNPVELIKRASLSAIEASKPVNIIFGNVVSVAPLKITIDQKITLGEKQLVLSRNVTDYTVMMTVNHTTQADSFMNGNHTHSCSCSQSEGTTNGGTLNTLHQHAYAGTKAFMVHNGLKVGETVFLMRMQGGQKFLIIDRVGG